MIYSGTFRFLSEGADKVVEELRRLVLRIKPTYEKAAAFTKELSTIADTGGRFSRLVSSFIDQAFNEIDPLNERQVQFKPQGAHTSEAIVSATRLNEATLALIGRYGNMYAADTRSGRFLERFELLDRNVTCGASFGENYIALGTEQGLYVVGFRGNRVLFETPYRERVVSIAVAPWGMVTGSRDGVLRKWTLAGGLSLMDQDSYAKCGRRIQKIEVSGDGLVVASSEDVVIVDKHLATNPIARMPTLINDIAVANGETALACGNGFLAHVNLARGSYTRMLTASDRVNYTCVAPLTGSIFCVGTEEGNLSAFDFNSGEELGRLSVGFELRGLRAALGGKFLAYGGAWRNNRLRAAIFVSWSEVINLHRDKRNEGDRDADKKANS